LKAADIDFAIIRLNDMRGGHKVDKGFPGSGLESDQFVRWPYFVYNPWVSGKANFEFMAKHMPDCGAVSADIEVTLRGLLTGDLCQGSIDLSSKLDCS
jgi:hypothetical protein